MGQIPVLLSFFLGVSSSLAGDASKWSIWVDSLKENYKKEFSSPSIVRHIYLEQGEQAYVIDEKGELRWTKNPCKNCLYKVSLEKGNKLFWHQLKNNSKKEFKKSEPSKVDKVGRIYLSHHFYESTGQVRVFIHDMKQKNISEKRKRHFFDYDPKAMIKAQFEWLKEPVDVVIQRSDGSQKKMKKIAKINYDHKGKKNHFSVYDFGMDKKQYSQNPVVMLLYRDMSNGKKTYGAGRFLNVDLKKPMGQFKTGDPVTVDLNYSYNPPCAVSSGFHCPLPQDFMAQSVLKGEKYLKH